MNKYIRSVAIVSIIVLGSYCVVASEGSKSVMLLLVKNPFLKSETATTLCGNWELQSEAGPSEEERLVSIAITETATGLHGEIKVAWLDEGVPSTEVVSVFITVHTAVNRRIAILNPVSHIKDLNLRSFFEIPAFYVMQFEEIGTDDSRQILIRLPTQELINRLEEIGFAAQSLRDNRSVIVGKDDLFRREFLLMAGKIDSFSAVVGTLRLEKNSN